MPEPASSPSDQRGRVLILHASAHDHTLLIANAIAGRIRAHGIVAEIGDARSGVMPPPEDYDAVVVGVPAMVGTRGPIAIYVRDHRDALAEVATAVFTVSVSGNPREGDPYGALADFVRVTGWHPALAAAFAGGEPLPRDGWLVRLIGHERTPAEIAALRTDWIDVDHFADTIAIELARGAG